MGDDVVGKTPRFGWSEVWLLTSISFANQDVGVDLKGLISVGDYINHAIFSGPELRTGLAKLAFPGYIVERELHFFLAGRAREFWIEQGKSRMDLRKWQDAFSKFLSANPYQPGQPAVADDPEWQYPGITDQMVDSAYHEYMQGF